MYPKGGAGFTSLFSSGQLPNLNLMSIRAAPPGGGGGAAPASVDASFVLKIDQEPVCGDYSTLFGIPFTFFVLWAVKY